MLEMAINNVEMGSELDRVHILTCCGGAKSTSISKNVCGGRDICLNLLSI